MADQPKSLRQLGDSDIFVSPIGFGCWPISGMTTVGTNERDSLATIQAAFESGINFLDTAYAYGANGESDHLIAKALRRLHRESGKQRSDVVIASKGGMHWDEKGDRCIDGHPTTLKSQLEQSLERLDTDYVDLFYLHAPDPTVPIEESAGACRELLQSGRTRSVGASNLSVDQLDRFVSECPLVACQPPYNMFQRQIEKDVLPWCASHQVSAITYWPLMKGLLAGKLSRDHQFVEGDSRANYEVFRGEEWERNQDVVDELRQLSREIGHSVADIVVNWTINQPSVTAALVGAKRPYQIRETASAMGWKLTPEQLVLIEDALSKRLSARRGDYN